MQLPATRNKSWGYPKPLKILCFHMRKRTPLMWSTWEKVVQHIGIALGQDISTEFLTRTNMVIPEPNHIQEIIHRHMHKFELLNKNHARLRESRNQVLELLAAYAAFNNLDAVLKTSEIQNKIDDTGLKIQEPLQIILTGDERSKHDTGGSTYQDIKGYLQRHRGKAFSIIRGQCK